MTTEAPADEGPDGRVPSDSGRAVGGRERLRRLRSGLGRLIPASFRARLLVAFLSIVSFALALLLAGLPPLLDTYFLQQEDRNLENRARLMANFVVQSLRTEQARTPGDPAPILLATQGSLRAAPTVTRALGTTEAGLVKQLSPIVAQADIEVTIAPDPRRPDEVVHQLAVPADTTNILPGQQRESLSRAYGVEFPDLYWSRLGPVPNRLVTVRLSGPYSFRAQTLQNAVSLMFAAALATLVLALIVSALLAARLTDPLRRLTTTARALGEGDLGARVGGLEEAPPEIAEMGAAFNTMADRLQGSMEYIRRDRDRSREFLADVSHELRTPIAALRTFNDLLRDGASEERATRDEFLEQSGQQIERLDWLAQNLLELSKLESGLVRLDLRGDDLRTSVEDAVHQAEQQARRRGLELRLDLPPTPVRLPHDPLRIGQVLNNLIGNAIKFTPRGGHVEVSLREIDEGAELRVQDTGVGIDPQELPRVFERFYRGSIPGEQRSGGSGLGLSIVRSIVDMHGGRVSIESALGHGTTVVVALPRRPAEVVVSSSHDTQA
jgi:signal transduction histidine kinase